jgi:hypothetical protein
MYIGRRHADRPPRPAPVLFRRPMYGVPVLPPLQYPAAAVGNAAVAQAPIPLPGPVVPPAPLPDAVPGFQGQLVERAFPVPDLSKIQFYGMFVCLLIIHCEPPANITERTSTTSPSSSFTRKNTPTIESPSSSTATRV